MNLDERLKDLNPRQKALRQALEEGSYERQVVQSFLTCTASSIQHVLHRKHHGYMKTCFWRSWLKNIFAMSLKGKNILSFGSSGT